MQVQAHELVAVYERVAEAEEAFQKRRLARAEIRIECKETGGSGLRLAVPGFVRTSGI